MTFPTHVPTTKFIVDAEKKNFLRGFPFRKTFSHLPLFVLCEMSRRRSTRKKLNKQKSSKFHHKTMDPDKGISVDDINKSLKRFGLADYMVFGFMLIMCSAVGIYFGFKDHKKHQRNKLKARRGSEELDYLMGGRNMQVFPVAMSLVASGLSGITLLGMQRNIQDFIGQTRKLRSSIKHTESIPR